ncbi:hypothetical protein H8D36_06280 [archaeon]|nr:hypothetical protein [archaeon]MBL7057123.1 hypothetical protein [Candidatus Woesearchaeota archaeon]
MSKKISSQKKLINKAPTKKTSTKKKGLKKVNPELAFFFSDGTSCDDILQLSDAIDMMADEVFEHHVSSDFNHFADWIEHVFDEKPLAKKIRKAKTKDKHRIEILTFVVKQLK